MALAAMLLIVITTAHVACGDPVMAQLAKGQELMGQGNNPDALEAFKQGLELEPENPITLMMVGVANEQMGLLEAAELAYSKAWSVHKGGDERAKPYLSTIVFNLGESYVIVTNYSNQRGA
jgi:Flp pilus assembly protein TadD